MRVILQRVQRASVHIGGQFHSGIGKGLLIFLGIGEADSEADSIRLSRKIVRLRIFNDESGRMNRSVKDIEGEILLVSQFTLYANTRKGNRPSFTSAAGPEKATALYEHMIRQLRIDSGREVATGVFAEDMHIDLLNEGPVTLILDSREEY